jgi:D-3-phosphoglycerate dehydrogenase
MLDLAVNLKYILRPGSGLDNIDVEYAKNKGIIIFNSPEANSEAVAEHAIGMLLGLTNFIPRASEQVRQRRWIRQPNNGFLLKGKTVGIIGYGNTGAAFAKRLSGFETKMLVYDKYKHGFGNSAIIESDMESIFEEADVISLHLPLSKETKYLVNNAFVQKVKKPFYLVNTSRGGIIELNAVIGGFKSHRLLGAALDVLENENLSSYSKEEKKLLDDLLNAGNVIITPHIAGWTKESRDNIFYFALEKFKKYLLEHHLA